MKVKEVSRYRKESAVNTVKVEINRLTLLLAELEKGVTTDPERIGSWLKEAEMRETPWWNA